MKKEIVQENKARWALLEQVGPLQSKIVWAVAVAVVVVLGIYLFR